MYKVTKSLKEERGLGAKSPSDPQGNSEKTYFLRWEGEWAAGSRLD